ncbi:MAG: hypothetical protein CL609_12615 [Anaerolineaceae bacterium]|nr:hypothetical protein [Anaerolineaceae bacterium]
MQNPIKYVFIGMLFGSCALLFFAKELAIPFNQIEVSIKFSDTSVEAENINQPEQTTDLVACTLPASFPQNILKWCQLINEVSAKYNLDPKLIASVMLQESGGNPDAYSHSGAVGLMQVMPRDGIASKFMCVNGPCFTNRPSMDELFIPDFNVDYGSQMLTNLIEKHGNWRDALKDYGPMDVGYHYADLVISIYNQYQ